MLQVTQPPPSKRTSFSIDDIVGRPRSRSPQQRSPCSTGSTSPRSDVRGEDLSPKSKHTDVPSDIQGKLDLFRSRLHGDTSQKAFQPVIPGLNGIRNPLHPGELLRSGLLNPESMGLLQHNLQNFHQSSHPLVNLHGAAPPGLIHPHSTHGFHGAGLPFGPQAIAPKDFLNLYHLQMHGAPHFLGHRFPDGLLLPPFRKPKRIRTAFSPSQLLQLERAFEKNHYVVGQERKELAVSLNLSETQVKVWFQNRRTKFKRVRAEETDGRPDGGESSMDLGHLDYLQEDDIDVTDSEDEEKIT